MNDPGMSGPDEIRGVTGQTTKYEVVPAGSEKRAKRLLVGLTACALLFGAAAGVIAHQLVIGKVHATSATRDARAESDHRGDRRGKEGRRRPLSSSHVDALAEALELTAEERGAVEEALQRGVERFHAAMEQVRPALHQARDAIHQEMRNALPLAKREPFDAFVAKLEMHDRGRRGRSSRGSREGGEGPTPEDRSAREAERFRALDTNGDGALDQAEWSKSVSRMRRGGRPGGMPGGMGKPRRGDRGPSGRPEATPPNAPDKPEPEGDSK
ncbi:MAG: hypothetical protein ACYS22_03230 [Planctomycetota bacterium]|jgi:hypothetical protein